MIALSSTIYYQKKKLCEPIYNLQWATIQGTSNVSDYPAYGLYNFSHTMFIIKKSELISAKQITGLQIHMGGYSAGYTYNNQIIKLAHITDSQFGTNVQVLNTNGDVSGIAGMKDLKTVKTFNWTVTSGFNNLIFDKNFCYNGSDNLLIIWINKDGSWQSGYGWAECHSTSAQFLSWYKQNDASYPTGLGTRNSSTRPNIKLNY
jgi:hypothetical protein